MTDLRPEAEALESRAAVDRVDYLQKHGAAGPLLDVGCGNGYAVAEWRRRGVRALGVDSAPYRLSRWLAEHPPGSRPFVLADAAALPFRGGAFLHSCSSGMLEHIGVLETSPPYSVTAFPGTGALRARVVSELQRVTSSAGSVVLDCPNGWFPVDFWHGSVLGAFRVHSIPDALNPSLPELRSYLAGPSTVLPLGGRLAFRQVGLKLWGRLLTPVVRGLIALLDLVPRGRGAVVLAALYPFLVVRGQGRGQSSFSSSARRA